MSKEHKVRLVIGLFWGDEGKAKAIDMLGAKANVVARYQGGSNAGHTVHANGVRYVFHQIPTGVLRENVTGVLGAGMVLDLPELVKELADLRFKGINAYSRIIISPRAHLVTIVHKILDKIEEKKQGIGTTLRGIGPTYTDKYARVGLRLGDLIHEVEMEKKAESLIETHRPIFESAGDPIPTIAEVVEPLRKTLPIVSDMVDDISAFLLDAIEDGQQILLEGAQGSMLDIDWGTYPYVTSSSTAFSGVASGLGIDPRLVDEVIGIAKAFTSRVGGGPFPTELFGPEAERLRGTGENEWDEFGSTTGRPRRCGWLDANVLRMNCRRWGVDKLFITKLDVLDGLETIKICNGYKICGKVLRPFPATTAELEKVEPIFEELEGWKNGVAGKKRFDDLPENAKYFIKRIEQLAGCPVGWISTGPSRENTIII